MHLVAYCLYYFTDQLFSHFRLLSIFTNYYSFIIIIVIVLVFCGKVTARFDWCLFSGPLKLRAFELLRSFSLHNNIKRSTLDTLSKLECASTESISAIT